MMRADTCLGWILIVTWTGIFLFGCAPQQTEFYLTKFNYLSSWVQAIGSLAAVWATFWIYKKNNIENIEKEKKRLLDNENKKNEVLKKEREKLELRAANTTPS